MNLIKQKRKPFIIYPDSSIKSYWNLVLTVLLLYTASYMPYGISFTDDMDNRLVVFEICVDFLFIIDVFMNFFTAYEDNKQGLEVDTIQLIVKKQFRTVIRVLNLRYL